MRPEVKKIADNFTQNKAVVEQTFAMESTYIPPICAMELAAADNEPSFETVKGYRKMLKNNASILSGFRGTAEAAVVTKMIIAHDPDQLIDAAYANFAELKTYFPASEYLALLSFILPEILDKDSSTKTYTQAKDLYASMKVSHPFLTNVEDAPMAVLAAMTGKESDELIQRMETAYDILKSKFSVLALNANALQAVSHVVAISSAEIDMAVERIFEFIKVFDNRERKYPKSSELIALALLAISEEPVLTLAEQVLKADHFLEAQPGYEGITGIDAGTRLMHAALMVALSLNENKLATEAALIALTTSAAGSITAITKG